MRSKDVTIVVIGAGSSFGRGILADIMGAPELRELRCRAILVDTNPEALDRMYRFGVLLRDRCDAKVTLEQTPDREQALRDADYVLTSVAIRRYPLWEQDFRVPLAYGFRHVLGENGGPGALFHALRNFELMLPIARDMERLCPDALLLNFTNPESRIIMAVTRLTKVRAVGLCHGAMACLQGVAKILCRSLDELAVVTGGLNHFFWLTKVTDKKTGEDLYPRLRDRVLHDPECPAAPPLVRKMVGIFGYYTYPSDDHIGEYLSFAHEFTGVKWGYGQESRPVPLHDPPAATHLLDDYVSGRRPLDEAATRKSGELAIPIVLDIECDRCRWEWAVNVPNIAGYVANLDREAIVEVPAMVDREGVHPQSIGALPDALAAFSARQVSIQKLLVEAYAQRSRNLLLQALLLDPVVDSVERAERMLDDMLELQKDYLPVFT